ncbi:recombinase family protein [Staphylococcus aureus]|uniref:recombinase family protein n=1 Tax=Staphylococcus TaxID=1279 RepID=UPI0013A6C1EE|nr:recombinase family protein [Staphylococcus aureus]NDQ73996.1 recombinase family protein [Staphylococcus aureus]HDE5291325.1 recombinase family protein [Staphylococcus aureus]HDE6765607.1 recombinase family protein [Staphylococcus aureus]HDZ8817161.1 recombinase family protein [Staphylococcus aureus]
MAKIGYARVSTKDQNLDNQIDTLLKYGCEKVFSEKISGKANKRSQFELCLDYLRKGDVLIVTKIDRLGRTTKQLIDLMEYLNEKGIEFKALDNDIDTNTPIGKVFFYLMSVFAELEVTLNSERTKDSLARARARGRNGGRPKVSNKTKEYVKMLYESKKYTGAEIAEKANVGRSTVYKILKEDKYEQ